MATKKLKIDDSLPIDIQKKRLLRTNPKNLTDKSQKELRERVIHAKKEALINALKMPPALSQFKNYLSEKDFEEISKIFSNYKPETRKERLERLEKKISGNIPIIIKSGIRHVTDLIEKKQAKLVLIACDVNPIEIVLFLPTLCHKLNIPYALVKSQFDLGKLVNRKKTTVCCLKDVGLDQKSKFNSLVKKFNEMFLERYALMMGGEANK